MQGVRAALATRTAARAVSCRLCCAQTLNSTGGTTLARVLPPAAAAVRPAAAQWPQTRLLSSTTRASSVAGHTSVQDTAPSSAAGSVDDAQQGSGTEITGAPKLSDEARAILSKVPNLLERVTELSEMLPEVDPLQLISRSPAIFDVPLEDIKRRYELLKSMFPGKNVASWVHARPALLVNDDGAKVMVQRFALVDQVFPGINILRHIDDNPKIVTVREDSIRRVAEILRTALPGLDIGDIVSRSIKILTMAPEALERRINALSDQSKVYAGVELSQAVHKVPQLLVYTEPRLDRAAFLLAQCPDDFTHAVMQLQPKPFAQRYGTTWRERTPRAR